MPPSHEDLTWCNTAKIIIKKVCIFLSLLTGILKTRKITFLCTLLVLGQMISSVTRQHDTLSMTEALMLQQRLGILMAKSRWVIFNSASSLAVSFLPRSLGSHLSFEAALRFLVFWSINIRIYWRQNNKLVWLFITYHFFVILEIQWLYFMQLHILQLATCNSSFPNYFAVKDFLKLFFKFAGTCLQQIWSIIQYWMQRKSWYCNSMLLSSSVSA